jgi:uncharacterized protein YrzB (UPF0473 family)
MSQNEETDDTFLDESEELEFVTLVDEDGKEETFAILLIVEFEGQEYAALTPAAQLEDEDSEEQDIFLFAYEESEDDDGELVQSFAPIEDESRFEQVSAFCESQLALLAGIEDEA